MRTLTLCWLALLSLAVTCVLLGVASNASQQSVRVR
ncbi:hypothetical protein ACV34C_32805, partial [Pseudomonas aeruginosa]